FEEFLKLRDGFVGRERTDEGAVGAVFRTALEKTFQRPPLRNPLVEHLRRFRLKRWRSLIDPDVKFGKSVALLLRRQRVRDFVLGTGVCGRTVRKFLTRSEPRTQTRPQETEDDIKGRCVRNLFLKRFRKIERLVFPKIGIEHDTFGEFRV